MTVRQDKLSYKMKNIAHILILVAVLSGCSGEQETEQVPAQETQQVSIMNVFKEGTTVQLQNGFSVFVEKKDGMTLRGLRVVKKNPDGSEERMEAERAILAKSSDQLELRMSNVTIYSGPSTRHERMFIINFPPVNTKLNPMAD
jgi:hypothetical protein